VADISSRSNFRSVQCGDMVVLCTDQNSARSSELLRSSTSRLEWPSCLQLLNIHQSRTIQSWSSSTKPTTHSKNIFILRVYCTYLLRIGAGAKGARKMNERERGLKKIRWSGRSRERERSGKRGLLKEVWAVSGNFNRSRSAHMLQLVLSVIKVP